MKNALWENAKPTGYVLALCAGVGGDVLRLHEHYGNKVEAIDDLNRNRDKGEDYVLFWSLYATYDAAPSRCVGDFSTPDEGLDEWHRLTGRVQFVSREGDPWVHYLPASQLPGGVE